MSKEKRKQICCPLCKNIIAHYDGRQTIDISADCRRCMKRITYRIASDDIVVNDIPARRSPGGVTFT